ncbi:MAG: DNA-binding response regulator [Bacteroidetes bacterium QH_7_64_110]|nr:MAG: DNA-binding response regulator [Bacteroidetes bacterium QH_7_64_110]
MADQVFLIDDHPVSRRGQKAVLNSEMNLEVCGEAGGAAEALDKIPEADPDLALVDLSLGTGSGLELIKDLQNRHPELLLLVVSMHDEALYALRCIRGGARGYVMKRRASETLVDAARQVLDGRIYLSEEMKERFVQTLNGHAEASVDAPLQSLSDRELEVFEQLGQGLAPPEIADQLHLSPKTVYTYQSRIKEKLGIESTPKLRQRAVIWVECCSPETTAAPS